MNANANGVGDYGVGGYGACGGHHGRIYQNDRESALNESGNDWRWTISPSLCPRKSEIGLMRRVLDDPTCETDLNGGGDGLRSDDAWRSYVTDCCWTILCA